MLHKSRDLRGVDDLYFDDQAWDVRYLVVSKPRRYLVQLTRAQSGRLRSGAQVIGCGIEARDGAIGRVVDLVFDDETWEITDVLVDSRQWLPGKLLLISPGIIERIDWPQKKVHLRLARKDILNAPEVRL